MQGGWLWPQEAGCTTVCLKGALISPHVHNHVHVYQGVMKIQSGTEGGFLCPPPLEIFICIVPGCKRGELSPTPTLSSQSIVQERR